MFWKKTGYFANRGFIILLFTVIGLNAQELKSLAVLELEGLGISASEADTLTARLRTALAKIEDVSILERERMMQLFDELQFTQTADVRSVNSMVELGRILEASNVITGSVGRIGSTYSINIRMVDVESEEIVSVISRDIRGDTDYVLDEMSNIAEELILLDYVEVEDAPAPPAPPPPSDVIREEATPKPKPLSLFRGWGKSYPKFPWPPPQASATEVIPRKMLELDSGPTLLRDVDSRLTEALEANGYYECSYYAVPAGFALVTKLEQINADGTSKELDERWILDTKKSKRFSLSLYLRALFKAAPGYFRIIVFITTRIPTIQSDEKVTRAQATKWFAGGLNHLPSDIGSLDFSDEGYECTAYIYEFERPNEVDEAALRFHGYPGRILLEKTGIWGSLTK